MWVKSASGCRGAPTMNIAVPRALANPMGHRRPVHEPGRLIAQRSAREEDLDYDATSLLDLRILPFVPGSPASPSSTMVRAPPGKTASCSTSWRTCVDSCPRRSRREVAPYLVRPTDPTSIFSQTPAALVARGAAIQGAAATVGCAPNAQGLADWRYFETENFVVWSCGGGIGGDDPYGSRAAVVGAVAEEDLYTKMEPKLGLLKADNHRRVLSRADVPTFTCYGSESVPGTGRRSLRADQRRCARGPRAGAAVRPIRRVPTDD